jgi:release factor glutamine methyltransferase
MNQNEIWTTLKILEWTQEYLGRKGVENARREAEWMLCAATGLDRMGLYLSFEKPLNETELASYRKMIARRAGREPLQHILGTEEFFGLDFEVTPDVLIPRHDSETLVQEALARRSEARSVLDIGTGSGCLAIALAKNLPDAAVTAVDISEAALTVAKRNAVRNSVTVRFLHGSLFEPVRGELFDLIVSNPPYIPTNEINQLEPEVRDFDPRSALDGGIDGLDFYRSLIPAAVSYLAEAGWLLVEVGASQASDVAGIFKESGSYGEPVIVSDAGGIERVVGAVFKPL